MGKLKRVEQSWTNNFGHTFNPGDQVVAVTTCTGNVSMVRATYIGYVEREEYSYPDKEQKLRKFVQIRKSATRSKAFYTDTNVAVDWSNYSYGADIKWVEEPFEQISTLKYNRILPAESATDQVIALI